MSRAAQPAAQAATPLMRQYTRVKDEHPDAFLFFRLGDFPNVDEARRAGERASAGLGVAFTLVKP